MAAELTLGPVLFKWSPDVWRDFYFRIADEAPVERVYLGEVVCNKRAPFIEPLFAEVTDRLHKAGKTVMLSTLTEVVNLVDRKAIRRIVDASLQRNELIEVNDTSALWHLDGRPCAVGPYMNVYNEDTLALLAGKGCRHVCLPAEMPAAALNAIAQRAKELGVSLEVQVYGRLPLALSARCYHARAHGRTKDSCQYVCEKDPDGMVLRTLENEPFLAINGIQTLSYSCLNLVGELGALIAAGIERFRISPHSEGTVEAANIFNAILKREMEPAEAVAGLKECSPDAPFSNGYFHGAEGHRWIEPGGAAETLAQRPAARAPAIGLHGK